VIDRGTAAPARYNYDLKGALAGKTGTTQFQSDGLFVGMTPKLVAGTWVGCFDRRVSFSNLRDGQGGKTALPIWGEFMKRLQADPEYKSYFNSYWSEDYKSLIDCPFTVDISELMEVNPSNPEDTLGPWPSRYVMRGGSNKGINNLIEDIFGNKEPPAEEPKQDSKQDSKEAKKEARKEKKQNKKG